MSVGNEKKNLVALACGVALFALAAPGLAHAQADQKAPDSLSGAAQEEADTTDKGDIVVTGTLLRGVAPAGSQVIGVGREAITATGATTTRELLATIPQVSNFFNALPQVGAASGTATQIRPPNVRNLPTSIYTSGASTLLLIDGHRFTNVGVSQFASDPDAIPVGAIERVEVSTDGGSSIYGADAIGGVINYITRRRFDGIKVDGHLGFADDYYKVDANLTAGKAWDTGSFWVAYSFAKNDAVMGRDRDYIKVQDYNPASPYFGLPTSRDCVKANIVTGGGARIYGVNGATQTLGQPNTCDNTDGRSLFPDQQKHAAMFGFSQDFGDNIKLDIKGFYTNRKETGHKGDFRGTVTVRPGAFYYRTLPAPDATANQTVSFSLAQLYGNDVWNEYFNFDEWGITPEVTVDLGHSWRARVMANVGGSKSSFDTIGESGGITLNTTLLSQYANGTTAATAINVYDIASSTPAQKQLIDQILALENDGRAKDNFYNFRAIVDGTLFDLPGGGVKVAAGTEYMKDTLHSKTSIANGPLAIDNTPFGKYSRNVWAVFGEVNVPLFGPENETTFFHALNLAVSGRYDKYSDFGSTFNPKFGLTWSPIEGVQFRGSWGKSFNAPTLLDQLGATQSTIQAVTNFYIPPPGVTAPVSGTAALIAVNGAQLNLKPQTSKSWSIGVDIDVPFIPGLRISETYYKLTFNGILDKPAPSVSGLISYPQFYICCGPTVVTPALIKSYADQTITASQVAEYIAGTNSLPVFELYDRRTNNLGNAIASGLDFSLTYNRETGFGSVDARLSGNKQLTRKTQVATGSPWVNTLLTNISSLSMYGAVGANVGNFRAQAAARFSEGFDITPVVGVGQTHIGSYTVVDLFFKYDFGGDGVTKDLSLTLNVDNVLDTNPPLSKDQTSLQLGGFRNGQTLGRTITFGISKKL